MRHVFAGFGGVKYFTPSHPSGLFENVRFQRPKCPRVLEPFEFNQVSLGGGVKGLDIENRTWLEKADIFTPP
jgi:hypothetical protein